MTKRLRLVADNREWMAEFDGTRVSLSGVESPLAVHDDGDGRFRVEDGGPPRAGIAAMTGDVVWVSVDHHLFEMTAGSGTVRSGARALDALTPPMSATVVRIAVKPGDRVKANDPLIVLEAMKMELPIRAPHDGVIAAINCREGDMVQPGTVLVEFAGNPMTIYEVAPRDGLQNEATLVPAADKIALVDRLSRAGLPIVEVSAFVSSRWVPQMADAAEVFAGITRRPGTRYAALVPNLKGLEAAMTAGVNIVAVFAAASETFSRRNINQSIDESFANYAGVAAAALAAGFRVRGYLSTAFGCPFEGAVPIDRVVTLTKRLLDLGAYEVAVSDTIGVAHPGQVRRVLTPLVQAVPAGQLALHFHDTRGTALANVLAALDFGIATFDASAGGLGGCPYAPGASGNLATEDLLYMLHGLGIETGVDLDAVFEASSAVAPVVGHALPSRYAQARLKSLSRGPAR